MKFSFSKRKQLCGISLFLLLIAACDGRSWEEKKRNEESPHYLGLTKFHLYLQKEKLTAIAAAERGEFYAATHMSHDLRTAFLEKWTNSGQVLWRRPSQNFNAMAALPGGGIVGTSLTRKVRIRAPKTTVLRNVESAMAYRFGEFGSDGRVSRIGPTGDLEWLYSKSDVSDVRFLDILVHSSGNIYAFGYIVSEDRSDADGFVAKLSADGQEIWTRTFAGRRNQGALNDWIESAVELDDGRIVLGGTTDNGAEGSRSGSPWIFAINEAGDSLWSVTISDAPWRSNRVSGPRSRRVHGSANKVLATRDTILVSIQSAICKLDLDGNLLQGIELGGSGKQRTNRHSGDYVVSSMAFDQDGNLIVVGSFRSAEGRSGEKDVWVGKIDAFGKPIWNRFYGQKQGETAFDVLQGGLVVAANHVHNRGVYGGVDWQGWLFILDADGYLSGIEIQKIPDDNW